MNPKPSPRVSIVIPTFNRAQFIGRALRSVFAQDFSDYELIVVDDASTDDTKSVVSSYCDDRLRYIAHSRNGGGFVARNTGIAAANGHLLTFLDSDDEWLPGTLAKLVDAWEFAAQQAGSNMVAAFGPLILKTPHSTSVNPTRGPLPTETIVDYIFDGEGMVSIITLVCPTSIARDVLFDPLLPSGQDSDFASRLACAGLEFHYIEKPLAIWHRTGGDHVSGSVSWRPIVESVDRRWYLTEAQKVRLLAIQIPPRAARAGDRRESLRYFLLGVASDVYDAKNLLRYAAHVALPPTVTDALQAAWSAGAKRS